MTDASRSRLTVGDGLRFGIGFVLAPIFLWCLFLLIGAWAPQVASLLRWAQGREDVLGEPITQPAERTTQPR